MEAEAWREASLPDDTRARLRLVAELPDDAPTTVPVLYRFLEDNDPRVRQAAAEALGRLGDPRALGALHKALTHGLPLKSHRRHLVACWMVFPVLFLILGLCLYAYRNESLANQYSFFVPMFLTQTTLGIVEWRFRKQVNRARCAAVESLVRVTEAHATAEVQQALPELRLMARSPLMYDRSTRRVALEAAQRIEDLTAHIRTLPVPAAPQPIGPEVLPRPAETAPEPDISRLPRVSEGR